MKKYIFSFLVILFAIPVLFTSCKDDPIPPDTKPDYEKANLTGYVELFDQADNVQPLDKMYVTIEGNSFMTYAETEKVGTFLLRNVPFYNNYTISYIKEGYGTFKIYNYNHAYSDAQCVIDTIPQLGMKSTTGVTSLVVVQGESVQFNISISTSASFSSPKYVRFLFHEINSVSDTTYSNYSAPIEITSNPASIVFTAADFQKIGMQSGSTYFAKAYGESYHTNQYFDFITSKEVFPNLCTEESAPSVEIVVP